MSTPGGRTPWAGRAVERERDLVDLDVLEDVAQVPRVKRDGRPVAFHGRIDLSLVVPDVGRRGDRHRPIALGRDRQLHDVGRRARDDRGQADCLKQLGPLDHRPRRVARGQDLLVIGELPVDEARHDVDALKVEEHLVACRGEDHVDRVVAGGGEKGTPISSLGAVSWSPPSSVRTRTLPRTGSVISALTARLTVWRPRARFSWMTESFTACRPRPTGGASN